MSYPIILPKVVCARWREACAADSLTNWHSLAEFLSLMTTTCELHTPRGIRCADMRFLAELAMQHVYDLQPVAVEVEA